MSSPRLRLQERRLIGEQLSMVGEAEALNLKDMKIGLRGNINKRSSPAKLNRCFDIPPPATEGSALLTMANPVRVRSSERYPSCG